MYPSPVSSARTARACVDAAAKSKSVYARPSGDGFVLADKDLAMRGPGDFLGTQQAGFVDLQMARLSDLKLIEMARREADLLFKQDPLLTLPEHQQLAALVAQSAATASGDVS